MRNTYAVIVRRKEIVVFAAGLLAVVAPFAFGFTRAIPRSVQSQSPGAGAAALTYEYDVASFKPNKSGPGKASLSNEEDGLTATNVTLKDLIAWAYGLRSGALDGRIFGAPGWLGSESYDIQAKMEGSVAEALKALPQNERAVARQHMLQKLLADRCGLVIHHETKELQVFLLVVAKDGPKLQESKPGESEASAARGPAGRGGRGLGLKGAGGPLTAREVPIADLVDVLSLLLNRPVLARTGLTGKYNFTLQWTPDETQDRDFFPAGVGQPPDPAGPSIFTAIQQQLGLKLESGNGPVDVIVIDRVEKPSGN
jgi:uncharacterized protein (TIGR03435 family)